MIKKRSSVLVIEDDSHTALTLSTILQDRGLDVLTAGSVAKAKALLQQKSESIAVALIDVFIPEKNARTNTPIAQDGGLALARFVKKEYPQIRIIGMSFFANEDVRDWFAEYGYAFLHKAWLIQGAARDFVDVVERGAKKAFRKRKPKCFVVHGQDSKTLRELIALLRTNFDWPRPQILRELPSLGRTIIEKFEDAARTIDLAFVLLTPDDTMASPRDTDSAKRRARQNVILELGYFYAKLQRTGGHVILLHKGKIELPSDISGVVYVDITEGLASVTKTLRTELRQWL